MMSKNISKTPDMIKIKRRKY